MLTLTENASTAVKHLTERIPADSAGLRIAQATAPNEGYAVTLADAPEEGDTVVELHGRDRVLDAQIDENGGVGFALAQRR